MRGTRGATRSRGQRLLYPPPGLDLRFAETKSLTDAISGQNLITFTRASSATVVNAAGALETVASNVPRFDHNPLTGESRGLLVEEQRSNLLLRSEEFDNASWSKNNSSITANTVAAPNGTVSADSLIETSTLAEHSVSQSFTAVSGNAYTLSVFVKSLSGNRAVKLRFTTTAWIGSINQQVDFSLTTGIGTTITGSPTFTSQAFPGGWWQFSMTTTSTANGTPGASIHLIENTGSPIFYTGNGTSGIYLWGAQLEAGSFPTSYIPTTTAAATRAADVASITGSNFSSWYRQDEGAVFCEFSRSALIGSSNFVNLWALSNNTASERFLAYNTGSSQTIDTAVTDDGVSQGTMIAPGAITANSTQDHAFVYKVNDFAAVRNAGSVITDTSGSLPTVDRIYIGANHSGDEQFSGAIRRLTYWPQRLPNNSLVAITR